MNWCPGGAVSKVLVSLVLVLIVLQYMFGGIGPIHTIHKHLLLNASRASSYYRDHRLNFKPHRRVPVPVPVASNATSATVQQPLYDTNYTASYPNVTTEPALVTAVSLCPLVPPNLKGEVEIVKSPVPTVQSLEQRFQWLSAGGQYGPGACRSRNRVGIIVPYRKRAEHLLLFLQHMHPFLRTQQINYTIFVVEQNGDGAFNRASLMNVGFKEATKLDRFDCFIFHDVDLLPEDDRNLYVCPEQPRHMSVAVDVFKYQLPYSSIFGGVSALTSHQFVTINGFSNSFWGWGGEDDDMSNRIRYHGYHISRYPANIARYTMLTHHKEKANPKRYENLQQGKKKYATDGLVNLKYGLLDTRKNLLYTWFLVDLYPPS